MKSLPKCVCGSGEIGEELLDFYGIYLTLVCDQCRIRRERELAHALGRYEHDEPLDGEPSWTSE